MQASGAAWDHPSKRPSHPVFAPSIYLEPWFGMAARLDPIRPSQLARKVPGGAAYCTVALADCVATPSRWRDAAPAGCQVSSACLLPSRNHPLHRLSSFVAGVLHPLNRFVSPEHVSRVHRRSSTQWLQLYSRSGTLVHAVEVYTRPSGLWLVALNKRHLRSRRRAPRA
jgi:hypothetical protein